MALTKITTGGITAAAVAGGNRAFGEKPYENFMLNNLKIICHHILYTPMCAITKIDSKVLICY